MIACRLLILAISATVLFAASSAQAETRVFTISHFDGYGIDECLAEGKPCGRAAATAWCRSRDFDTALDFGRLDRSEATASLPIGRTVSACTGRGCSDLVAIVCSR